MDNTIKFRALRKHSESVERRKYTDAIFVCKRNNFANDKGRLLPVDISDTGFIPCQIDGEPFIIMVGGKAVIRQRQLFVSQFDFYEVTH